MRDIKNQWLFFKLSGTSSKIIMSDEEKNKSASTDI